MQKPQLPSDVDRGAQAHLETETHLPTRDSNTEKTEDAAQQAQKGGAAWGP